MVVQEHEPAARARRIAFVSSEADDAERAASALRLLYDDVPAEEADVIVALGGDGLMLQSLHRFMGTGVPIYGMNRGTIGFLMNEFGEEGLVERIEEAVTSEVRPLRMDVTLEDGSTHCAHAINEVSLLRQSYQAAKLEIAIDARVRLEELVCDGVLVATPAGSTAYNFSAHGPIIPIGARLLALTPISPFRPRRWRGALLPDHVEVRITVLEGGKRPVNAVADHTEFKSVREVRVREDREKHALIMFDRDHSWEDRILTEQFRY